jgi:cysteinyl-tRNA synthetase
MAYRLFLLGGHYRSQLDFTSAGVEAAQATLRRLVARVTALRPLPVVETLADAEQLAGDDPAAKAYLDQIDAAISADLATPKILASLQESLRDPALTESGQRLIVAVADALLGLRLGSLELREVEGRASVADLPADRVEQIERLIEERTQARKEKNWARADEIRTELDALNVQVTDTPAGPVWELR